MILNTLVIGVVLCIIAVPVLELLSRLWLASDDAYCAFAPRSELRYELDAAALPQLPSRVVVRINSDGERGDECGGDRDTLRVLVAGGSAAQCLYIDQQSTWFAVMQQHLSSSQALATLRASRVHVGSIGKSGIHSASVSLILRRVLPRYRKIDVIILMIGAGDALRWIANNAPTEGIPAPDIAECFEVHPEHRFGLTLRSSAIAEVLKRLRARLRVQRRTRVGRWLERARAARNNPRELREGITDPTRMLAEYETRLQEIIDLSRMKARHVLVVRQPWFQKETFTPEENALFWNFGVENSSGADSSIFYAPEVADALLAQIDASSARVAHRSGVGDLDLRPLLAPSTAHYYDQFHFTVEGNRLVACIVAEHVLGLVRGD